MIRERRLERCSSIRKYKAFDALLKHFGRSFVCIDCGDSSETLSKDAEFPDAATFLGLPWWLRGAESTCSAGDPGGMGLVPGLGRSPGGGNGSPHQHSCLENPVDRGAWGATVHRTSVVQAGRLKIILPSTQRVQALWKGRDGGGENFSLSSSVEKQEVVRTWTNYC